MNTLAIRLLGPLTLVVAACSSPATAPTTTAPAETPAETPGGLPAAVTPNEPADPERLEQVERELAALRSAVEQNPQDAAARQALGRALVAAKRAQQAVEHFERAVAIDPGPRHLMDLALAYGAVSRLGEAEATYERLLALVPGDPIVLHNRANIAMKRGDPARAVALLEQAIAARPDYVLAWFHLAQALEKLGRHEEAYRAYEKVLTLEPANAEELTAFDDALYGLGALDLEMGDYPRAARLLAELIQASPEHPNAYYAYGQALLRLGRPAEAQRALDTHMQLLARREPEGPVATGD